MGIKNVIVGTAGHIDHGKSTLVEALTGTNPDRLQEEKRRGITIDLGFAFLALKGVCLGFVDVPGHERFVRNMLSGAGGIDLVLLVVAANESIKPQTREHFDICRLLAVRRGVVAITKSDLVDSDELALVKLEVEEFVRDSFLEGAPVVGVSARTSFGLDALRQELLSAAQTVPVRDSESHFRLPIDRSFAIKGFGTVVTGTLISGTLLRNDETELHPSRQRLRVRGLHSGGQSIDRALAGQRTAVNLGGIGHEEIRRGMVLAQPGIFEPTQRLDARILLLPSAPLLKNRAHAHFHQGTADATAEVILLESNRLEPGASALAQLRLRKKMLLLPGDRFVLRQFSPALTIGGGSVIDVRARRHRPSDPLVAAFLNVLEHGTREDVVTALVEAHPEGLALAEIVGRTGWLEREVHDATSKLVAERKLRKIASQPLVFASERVVGDCKSALCLVVDAFHKAQPLLSGIPKQELRGRAGNPRLELFDTALDELLKSRELSLSGDRVQRAGRTLVFSPEEARAKELIEREFERSGLLVPNVAAVLDRLPVEAARAQKIFQILLHERVLVKITDDLVFHGTALAQLRALLGERRKDRGPRLSIAAFKELTGVSRKYAIPLLEYLDREHVTRRQGDERVIL